MAKPVRHRNKWRIRWIDAEGRRRSEVHSSHRVAEHKLAEHKHHAEQVRRGLRRPDPPTRTFGDLCDYWLKQRARRKRSRKDDQSIIRRHLRPDFGELKLSEVTVERVDWA